MTFADQKHATEMKKLIEKFKQDIWPWMRANNFSVFDALSVSQNEDTEKFEILNRLWTDYCGRNYIRSFLRINGGRII